MNTLTLGSGQVLNYKVIKPRKRRLKYNHPKKQSLVVGLLNEIESHGSRGMRVGEMTRWLWEKSHPDIPYDKKKGKSRWGTNFYGSGRSSGLLYFYCTKVGKRWVRNNVPHNDKPWATVNASSRKSQGSWTTQWNSTPAGVQTIVASQSVNP